ncbi:hypothetical protein [Clostridium botulinum]|nr:hypothetical protein [Clostridium botulinum]
MITLDSIREKNKNEQSFLNTKITKNTFLKKNMQKEEKYFHNL